LIDCGQSQETGTDSYEGGPDNDEYGVLTPPLYYCANEKTEYNEGEHEGEELES